MMYLALTLAFLSAVFLGCSGHGRIDIRFMSYSSNCEEDAGLSACDPQFTFCLDNGGDSVSISSCSYDRVGESGHFQDTTYINLAAYSNFKGIDNPWEVPMTSLIQPLIMLVTRVRDDDFFSDDHLVTWGKTLNETVWPSLDLAEWEDRSMSKNGHVLKFKIRIFCDSDYFPPLCSKKCTGKDDDTGHYTCNVWTGDKICMKGWQGESCTEDVNECNQTICVNGTCENLEGDYVCYCTTGYTGRNCSIEIDPCEERPCQNNGTCTGIRQPFGFTCNCTEDWEGTLCTNRTDPCDKDPCLHDGVCFSNDNNTMYSCDCVYPYTGFNCNFTIANYTTVAPDSQGQDQEDSEGFVWWYALLICLILIIIVILLLLCLVIRRRRKRRAQKEPLCPVGLPASDSTNVMVGNDNLAFENGMYNDVRNRAVTTNGAILETPTTPSDDDLFNPVKPVFCPDTMEMGAAGGAYQDMDADGYVKPSGVKKEKTQNLQNESKKERAPNNPYADFGSLKGPQPSDQQPDEENHYHDLDEMAMHFKVYDNDMKGRGQDDDVDDVDSDVFSTSTLESPRGTENSYSNASENVPRLQLRPNKPSLSDVSDDDDVIMPDFKYPGLPLQMMNPASDDEADRASPSPRSQDAETDLRQDHEPDFSENPPRNSNPFSEKMLTDEEDSDTDLPSFPPSEKGGYATPQNGSMTRHPTLESQESHYDSPRNGRPSTTSMSTTASDYDSPRSSTKTRPRLSIPPEVAPKPPIRLDSNTLSTNSDAVPSFDDTDFDEPLPPPPEELEFEEPGETKVPRPISIVEGVTLGEDDLLSEDEEDNADENQKNPLQKVNSLGQGALYLQNQAFSLT